MSDYIDNPVGKLQEYTQKYKMHPPLYKITKDTSSPTDEFYCTVTVPKYRSFITLENGEKVPNVTLYSSQRSFPNKKACKQAAAMFALESISKFEQENVIEHPNTVLFIDGDQQTHILKSHVLRNNVCHKKFYATNDRVEHLKQSDPCHEQILELISVNERCPNACDIEMILDMHAMILQSANKENTRMHFVVVSGDNIFTIFVESLKRRYPMHEFSLCRSQKDIEDAFERSIQLIKK